MSNILKRVYFFSSIFLVTSFFSTNLYSSEVDQCEFDNSNQVLDLIKMNHHRIQTNDSKLREVEQSINVAKQRLNPELNIDSSIGDSVDGRVYTTAISLQHKFELGGKRDSRIELAEKSYATAKAISIYKKEFIIVKSVLQLHRLRQVYELIPLYKESLNAFNKILNTIKKRRSLSPEQQVERATLELVTSDYKLKISKLVSEKINLGKHLSFHMGKNCRLVEKVLPQEVDLETRFSLKTNIDQFSKINAAKLSLGTAKANLKLQKSYSVPDLLLGPRYEYQRVNIARTNAIGLSLTIDLPVLSLNQGERAKASREIQTAKMVLSNVKSESELEIRSWITKYNEYRNSLRTIANKKRLEKKHRRIESLFKRGIISTSLVIESHRQLIEFAKTRFDFEIGATEALWNIYKIKGTIKNKKL